jgi:hypothetical protein
MTRRFCRVASRYGRCGAEGRFLYVLSFAEAVRRRRRRLDPRPPTLQPPTPPRPRPLAAMRPLSLKPVAHGAPRLTPRTPALEEA